jgi:hypothetical protein
MTVLDDRVVTNRKAHQCFACQQSSHKKEKMRVTTIVHDEIYRVRACMPCNELLKNHKEHFIDEVDFTFPEACVVDRFADFKVKSSKELLEKLNKEINECS